MAREQGEKAGSQTGGMLFHVVGLPCRDLLDNRVWGSRKRGEVASPLAGTGGRTSMSFRFEESSPRLP